MQNQLIMWLVRIGGGALCAVYGISEPDVR